MTFYRLTMHLQVPVGAPGFYLTCLEGFTRYGAFIMPEIHSHYVELRAVARLPANVFGTVSTCVVLRPGERDLNIAIRKALSRARPL